MLLRLHVPENLAGRGDVNQPSRMITHTLSNWLFSRKVPFRLIGYVVVVIISITVISPLLWMAHEGRLKRRYEFALDRIQVGDSEETVIELMGKPTWRDWCRPLPTDADSKEVKQFHDRCFITYTYSTFMEHYGVSFDKNNRVSGTFRSVSP